MAENLLMLHILVIFKKLHSQENKSIKRIFAKNKTNSQDL
jgi:hypothetical protein